MTTSTLTETSGILDSHAMKFLAGRTGPCITIVVPAHHPGAQEGSRRALVHSLVRAAGERMTRGNLASRAAELLAPLEEIARESGVETGGAGFVIFRSPEYTARYYLPAHHLGEGPVEKAVVADHFYLTPFLTESFAPHEFFILALSRKHLRLFRYLNGECRELPLPAAVPPSLEAAGGFDRPDHALENRSSAGPSTGAMRGVHFGTLSDREAAPEYLHNFFLLVDRGLKPVLEGKPLLLMGVHEQVAAYRRAARYPHILTHDYLGNVELHPPSDIAPLAAEACRAHYQSLAERAFAEFREMPDRGRTLADVPDVLEAARGGRVHRLCVRTGAQIAGPDGQDLTNTAVAETLRAGGEVFMVPRDKMPTDRPLAAILRY